MAERKLLIDPNQPPLFQFGQTQDGVPYTPAKNQQDVLKPIEKPITSPTSKAVKSSPDPQKRVASRGTYND